MGWRVPIVALTGSLLLVVSALVMVGWVARVPWMVQLIPGTVPMVFSNAACLFLLGIALLLTATSFPWRKLIQVVIGTGVLITGSVVLLQYRLDLALPLDLTGLHGWHHGNPGRMAPNTALAHVLAGISVVLIVFARPGMRALPALLGAGAVAMMGITGLVGYRLQPELMYGWHIETRMALHTGLAFVLLGAGLATTVYRTQQLGELFRQREDLRVGLLAGGLMAFVGLVGGLVAFTLMQEQMESMMRSSLQLLFQGRRDLLVAEVSFQTQSTREFAQRPGIQRELMRLQTDPGNRAALGFIQEALTRHVNSGPNSIRLFDARGRFLAGAGPEFGGKPLIRLRQPDEITMVDDQDKIRLSIVQPVESGGRRIGRLESLSALPDIDHMLKDVEVLGKSGEMQLCARNEPMIRCLPMRLTPQRIDLPETTRAGPTIIARALGAEQGVGLEIDYRGRRVIAAYGPITDLGLGMVLKIDTQEIYAPLRQRFELTFLVVLLIIATGIVLLRARLVPLVRRLALSEKRFRGLLEAAPDAMVVTDLDGCIVWVNSQAEQLFGYSRTELLGQPVEILVPVHLRETHVGHRRKYTQAPHTRNVGVVPELLGLRKDGSIFPAEIGLSPQETEDGLRVISTVRDISERQQAIDALRESEQRWQFALEGARDGVWDWNLVTDEVYFSRQWKHMLGYEEHEIGSTLEEWDKRVHPDDKAAAYADIERHLEGEVPYYQNEHRVLCKDGSYKWILDRGMVVARDAQGKPTRMIGTHTDITDRKKIEDKVQELSLVDDLTGLRNRRGFLVLAESQLSLARRLGRSAVLFFGDLDGLKRINDEFGHEEGDRALADVAEILRATFRDTDILGRLGGDEFVVFALESPGDEAKKTLARLDEHVKQHNRTSGRPFKLAISVGMVHCDPDSMEPLTKLLRRADIDMYRVKQLRRAGSGAG